MDASGTEAAVVAPVVATTPADRLLGFLEEQGRSLSPLHILTHDFPDPDALAAAFALAYLAKERFSIDCRIRYGGVIGRGENAEMVRLLRIPARRMGASDLKRFKNVALVDTQPAFANNPFPVDRRASIVIDQHKSHADPNADLSIVDTKCGATCVIVARALLLLEMEIPTRVATALAYGIITDTLELYRARRRDVVDTYLGVLSFADMKTLARIRNPSRSRGFFVTLGRSLDNAQKMGRLVVSHLGGVQNPDLISELADLMLTYKQVSWSFCTGRYKGRLHVSLRTSEKKVNAGEILRSIGPNRKEAGGHGPIAGGAFKVGKEQNDPAWADLEESLTAGLCRHLRITKRTKVSKPFAE